MVVDSDLRIVTVNPAAESVTGHAGGEILGMRLQELFGPELWGDGSLMEKAIAEDGIVAPTEATLAVGAGTRDVLLGVAPLRDGYLLSFADITELKEVDRVKSNLVANVSHELRAPLASIKAYSELLLDDLADDTSSVSRRFLTVIDRESDRLAGLLNDLLDISRLEQRRVAPPMKLLSVRSMLEDAVSLLGVQANERGIVIKLDIDPDLPLILANKDLIMTMVRNLLGNAVKFSHEGGTVVIRVGVQGENAVIDFIDEGMGIAEHEIPQLFSKFYRTQAALDAGITGTGLGLVLAREAVRAHGGNIKVVSELGVGSQFIVTLPLAETQLDEEVPDNGAEPAQVLAAVPEAAV
jgi:two-component system phosphate regulon sensor histidine kinase PhoR